MSDKSKMLERAIIDAEALKDVAKKSAQSELIEKYSKEFKRIINKKLFEAEEGKEEDKDLLLGGNEGSTGDVDELGGEGSPDLETMSGEGGAEGSKAPVQNEPFSDKEIGKSFADGENIGGKDSPGEDEMMTIDLDQLSQIAKEEDGGKTEEITDELNIEDGDGESPDISLDYEKEETDAQLGAERSKPEEQDGNVSYLQEGTLEFLEEEEELDADEEKEEDIIDFEAVPEGIIGDYSANSNTQESSKIATNDLEDEENSNILNQAPKAEDSRKEKPKKEEDLEESYKKVNKVLKRNIFLIRDRLSNLEEQNNVLREALIVFGKELKKTNLTTTQTMIENRVLSSDSLNERQKRELVDAVNKTKTLNEAKGVFEKFMNSTKKIIVENHSVEEPQENKIRLNEVAFALKNRKPSSGETKEEQLLKEKMQKMAGIKSKKN
ncbi:hypothetical protein M0R19_04220 [Candidatus Pacearchaeota archaeon]|nr:hypothetical protein [Candidatus Pacearchaeota archaeon]